MAGAHGLLMPAAIALLAGALRLTEPAGGAEWATLLALTGRDPSGRS